MHYNSLSKLSENVHSSVMVEPLALASQPPSVPSPRGSSVGSVLVSRDRAMMPPSLPLPRRVMRCKGQLRDTRQKRPPASDVTGRASRAESPQPYRFDGIVPMLQLQAMTD